MPLSKNCISKNINKVCNLKIAHFVFMLCFLLSSSIKHFYFLSNSFHDGNDNCISALFISSRKRNSPEFIFGRKTLKRKTFIRCKLSYAEIIPYYRHSIVIRSHICFQSRTYIIFSPCYTAVINSVYTCFILYTLVQYIVIFTVFVIVVNRIMFYITIYYIINANS